MDNVENDDIGLYNVEYIDFIDIEEKRTKKEQILYEKELKIVNELRVYAWLQLNCDECNEGIQLSSDTMYYCQVNMEHYGKEIDEDCIEMEIGGHNAFLEIIQIIDNFQITGKLKYEVDNKGNKKMFEEHIFKRVLDKIKYIETRDKRLFKLYSTNYKYFYRDIVVQSNLKEDFIQKYLNELMCKEFFEKQILTQEFIKKNIDVFKKNDDFYIHKKMSEEFIEENLMICDDEDINYGVFVNQKLSIEFILKHIGKIKDYFWIKHNKNINKEQLEENNIEMVFKMREVA